jgi:hypothetical protein
MRFRYGLLASLRACPYTGTMEARCNVLRTIELTPTCSWSGIFECKLHRSFNAMSWNGWHPKLRLCRSKYRTLGFDHMLDSDHEESDPRYKLGYTTTDQSTANTECVSNVVVIIRVNLTSRWSGM